MCLDCVWYDFSKMWCRFLYQKELERQDRSLLLSYCIIIIIIDKNITKNSFLILETWTRVENRFFRLIRSFFFALRSKKRIFWTKKMFKIFWPTLIYQVFVFKRHLEGHLKNKTYAQMYFNILNPKNWVSRKIFLENCWGKAFSWVKIQFFE